MNSTLQKIFSFLPDNSSKKITAKNVRDSFSQINDKLESIASGYQGDLTKTDLAPTVKGIYGLLEIGVYPNLGNINAEEGKLNFASFDGTTWSLLAVDLPKDGSLFKYPDNVPIKIYNAILSIELINLDLSKQFTLAVVRKKILTDSNVFEIKIYEWVNGTFGSTYAIFSKANYIPSANIDKIELLDVNMKNTIGYMTIDWSVLEDGFNMVAMEYSKTGLNNLNIKNSIFGDDINSRLSLIESKYDYRSIFQPNADVPNIYKTAILGLKLYNAPKDKVYTLAVVRKKATTSPIWQISVYEWVNGTFGANAATWETASYTPTSSVETIRLNGSISADITIDWSKIPDGTVVSAQGYDNGGLLDSLKINEPIPEKIDEIFDIILPSTIFIPNTTTYWFYDNCIIENEQKFNHSDFNLKITGNNLTRLNDFTKITSSTNSVQFVFQDKRFLTKSNKYLTNSLTKTLNIQSKTKATGITLNTLIIGDSYIDKLWGDGILEYVKQFASADGNNVVYKGTRTSYGNLGENYESWNESRFYSYYVPIASREPVNGNATSPNMSSPFVFSDNDTVESSYFSFSKYLTNNNISGINNIIFFLGMNSGSGNQINSMISNIKTALPSVKIIICTVPNAEIYGQNYDTPARQLAREILNKNYISLFDNRTSENIFLAPTHATFHRKYGLIGSETSDIQFNLDSFNSIDRYVTNHHPTASGAKSLAYMIYSYLIYINS